MCNSASLPQTPSGHCATKRPDNSARPASYVKVVKEPGRRAQLLFQLDEHALGAKDVGHLALRIKDVAELSRSDRANFDASRIAAHPCALDAEMTLLHHPLASRAVPQVRHVQVQPFFRDRRFGEIKMPGPIGAGGFTIPAADAPVVVDHRNAVRLLPSRVHGANLHARRIFALLALHRHVEISLFRDLDRKSTRLNSSHL